MDEPDYARLAYLVLLGAVLLGWFMVQNRQSLGRMSQQAIAWVLIFLGVVSVYGLWEDIRQTVTPRQSVLDGGEAVRLPRAPDGHFYVTVGINGVPVDFLVDTGASQVVLSRRDAERVGIDPDGLVYHGRARTANGEVRTAPVRLDLVELGPFSDRNVRAWVNEGDMDKSLLGMSYLQRWSRIEITGEGLVLTR